jgi:hypothetical protein
MVMTTDQYHSWTAQVTCQNCGSSVEYPRDFRILEGENHIVCPICTHSHKVNLTSSLKAKPHHLDQCVLCQKKDFYSQPDFNRKLGVIFFVIGAVLSIWTYGLSLLGLYLIDLFLFRKLSKIAICYHCQTIYRKLGNMDKIGAFQHEVNDRVVYAGHDFQGQETFVKNKENEL